MEERKQGDPALKELRVLRMRGGFRGLRALRREVIVMDFTNVMPEGPESQRWELAL